jgi:GntR family transcriptional repressor for pyruvate dehydrogenase complex
LRTPSESPESRHHLVERVVERIGKSIKDRLLNPGERLPSERDLARQLKVSRATVRHAIQCLTAMAVLKIRPGVGTFVADGPPEIGRFSFALIGALYGFQPWQMFEARIILESSLAALAAERGKERHFLALAEEVTEMYATCQDPAKYLIHDVRFHRAIASASGNPILAALMETIVTALYENRRETVHGTTNLNESAQIHRDIYHAIHARNAACARRLMEQHLRRAEAAQLDENPRAASGFESRSAPPIVQALPREQIQPRTKPS